MQTLVCALPIFLNLVTIDPKSDNDRVGAIEILPLYRLKLTPESPENIEGNHTKGACRARGSRFSIRGFPGVMWLQCHRRVISKRKKKTFQHAQSRNRCKLWIVFNHRLEQRSASLYPKTDNVSRKKRFECEVKGLGFGSSVVYMHGLGRLLSTLWTSISLIIVLFCSRENKKSSF